MSVSQIKTARDCVRKNWMEKVARMPIIFAGSTTRGSILHEVCERWLEADDNDLDSEGNPVNLYPEGWHIKTEKDQSKAISVEEQEWIKRSVQEAISKNHLIRYPDRVVEWEFLELLVPAEEGKPAVWLVG